MTKATLVLPVRAGQIYLARKKPNRRQVGEEMLNGYGGVFEPGVDQDIFACGVREFTEETDGARTYPSHLTLRAIIDFHKAGVHKYKCFVFLCSEWEGALRETSEMGPGRPYSLNIIPYAEMMPGDAYWLWKVLAQGPPFFAKVFYNADNTEVLEYTHEPFF